MNEMNETKIVDEELEPSGSQSMILIKYYGSRGFGMSEPNMKEVQDLYNEMKEAEISEKAEEKPGFSDKSKRGRV